MVYSSRQFGNYSAYPRSPKCPTPPAPEPRLHRENVYDKKLWGGPKSGFRLPLLRPYCAFEDIAFKKRFLIFVAVAKKPSARERWYTFQ